MIYHKRMIDNDKEILTIYEFAKLISAHHNTVRKMIKTGRLVAFRLSSGKTASYRIARSEIERLVLIDLEIVYKNKGI